MTGSPPGFVVLQQRVDGAWVLVGEVPRRPGLTSRAARSMAIVDASRGAAKAGEAWAAVLRSEWRLALDWELPKP